VIRGSVFGIRYSVFGIRVSGFGFRVSGLGVRVAHTIQFLSEKARERNAERGSAREIQSEAASERKEAAEGESGPLRAVHLGRSTCHAVSGPLSEGGETSLPGTAHRASTPARTTRGCIPAPAPDTCAIRMDALIVLNLRTTTSQKCEAVPRRARI